MTRYVVLTRKKEDVDGNKPVWTEYARHAANSAEQAIRESVDGHSSEHFAFAEFVAVPERSWKPLGVGVETQRRVVIGAQESAA